MAENETKQRPDLGGAILDGAPLFGSGDTRVGTIVQIHGAGPSMQVIVSMGGILGIGETVVVVTHEHIKFTRADDGSLRATTTLSVGELKTMTPHSPE
ncbi:MAG: PRC-barrel domain containing protein [Bosea sp.]|uniref:PRC-barrel domain containing protein n=1 Tax=Bosea sp. (in: a-proteobacteria) TaxID=1871050 RepID=UPI001AD08B88|nr:PRC-barrel domain containing protein [Bosea sp. (in: a-proteobacteria)]MBN9452257.1 PRC-barrel domain containing protein [Bosea sp. (in: a-proteobacteria)]